ncbi:MAG: LysR family transcriptional regulator [Haliea sp.]|uniref:LysR family transcriptional regulator n=1 Tax=Haliea sp. TaxID=1932666 RepID=UPI0032EFBF1C
MIPALTLDALRVLDAIDRRHSFAAAAEELFRVPSAVSYTVNKLEQDLGVALFDRSRRRAELTPVGRLVLEHGRRILLAADELGALARQAAEGWETMLRIGIDSVLSPGVVFAVVEEFQRVQPRTEIRLVEEVLGGTWDALNDGRCDLVIGAAGAPPGPGFGLHPLGQVVFEFAVARDHPLALLPQPVPERAVADYPTVVVADSSRHLPGRSSGLLDGRSRLVVASIEQKIEAQCRGLGVGYLPRHRILRQLNEGCLRLLTLETPRAATDIAVAWRRRAMGKGLKWLVARLRTARFDPDDGLLLAQA